VIFIVLLYRRCRCGYAYRRIPLTQGKFAIVDPQDYKRLSRHKWYTSRYSHTCYAIRGQWSPELKKRLTISMHREIIDVPEDMFIDHINHNGLDNRRANLRPATPAQNSRNARYPKTNKSSKYRGVWYNKQNQKWRSVITVNRKKKQLGYFNSARDAAIAYDRAAKKYHKKFAITNFPKQSK
jgi:hypothetical protein